MLLNFKKLFDHVFQMDREDVGLQIRNAFLWKLLKFCIFLINLIGAEPGCGCFLRAATALGTLVRHRVLIYLHYISFAYTTKQLSCLHLYLMVIKLFAWQCTTYGKKLYILLLYTFSKT